MDDVITINIKKVIAFQSAQIGQSSIGGIMIGCPSMANGLSYRTSLTIFGYVLDNQR